MFSVMTDSIEYVRAGKLRALAVPTASRSEALPDIPTVGEFVPGYEGLHDLRHAQESQERISIGIPWANP